jgi:hypothetical protein
MKTVELLNKLYENLSQINPTIIFNEGWMVRILVEISINERLKFESIDFSDVKNFSSEALIDSPFVRRVKNRESCTHTDIIFGDFTVNYEEHGKITVNPDAQILGIIEAKMGSGLSKKTTNADDYNQASRSICCLAHNADKTPEKCALFFIVVAPETTIKKHKIKAQVEYNTIKAQIEKRFDTSHITNNPTIIDKIDKCNILVISYEKWIAEIKNQSDKLLMSGFYEKCKSFNKVK